MRDAFAADFALIDEYPPGTATMKNLILYLSERSQAITALIQDGYVWDAEMLLRVFYECAAKIWFLGFQNDSDREILAVEFWEGLGEIHDRKACLKATIARETSLNMGDLDSARVYQALMRNKDSTPSQGNKASRKELEQKWSFTEILSALEKDLHLVEVRSLLHMYGQMSHLVHADQAALNLMLDRATRPKHEKALLRAAHICRMLNDLLSIWTMSLVSFRKAMGKAPLLPPALRDNWEATTALANPIVEEFHDSQREFYDRILNPEKAT